MSNESKEIKITDKRMFTADGELREEYRFLNEKSTAAPPAPAPAQEPAPAGAAPAAETAPPPRRDAGRSGASGSPRGASGSPSAAPAEARPGPGAGRGDTTLRPEAGGPARSRGDLADLADLGDLGDASRYGQEPSARLELPGSPPGLGPSFYDLAALLAEPVPIYLGDVELPDGQSAENIEMARLYIDLLDVLRQKTAGNLTAQEAAFLEDLLYRLRVRYVQKRG